MCVWLNGCIYFCVCGGGGGDGFMHVCVYC